MSDHHIRVSVRTTAAPATVYALLRDGAGWPTWSPLGSFELVSEGEDGGESVGSVRIFRTGRTRSRERIVELVPDRRYSYVLLSGLAIDNYRADVDLHPDGDGTVIQWHSAFDSRVTGTGWIYRLMLGRFITALVHGLAERAATTADRAA